MLPEGWTPTTLGEVIRLEYGASLPAHNRRSGSIPVYGSSGITGYHDESLVEGPVVVIGRKGSAGNVFWSSVDCYPIDTTYWAKCSPAVDPRFGFYLLAAARLPDLASGTGVPGLDRRRVTALSVVLPPLNEQHRIVAVLEQADRAVEAAARHAADAEAMLIASIEGETYRLRGTRQVTIDSVADVSRGYAYRSDDYAAFGTRLYSLKSLYAEGGIRPDGDKFLRSDISPSTYGDAVISGETVVVAMTAVTPDRRLIGASATVEDVGSVFSTDLAALRPHDDISARYLDLAMRASSVRQHLKARTTGTTVGHLPTKALAKTEIPLPPLAEQEAIVARIEKVEAAVRAAKAHLERLRALRSSLLENLVSGRVRLPTLAATTPEVTA